MFFTPCLKLLHWIKLDQGVRLLKNISIIKKNPYRVYYERLWWFFYDQEIRYLVAQNSTLISVSDLSGVFRKRSLKGKTYGQHQLNEPSCLVAFNPQSHKHTNIRAACLASSFKCFGYNLSLFVIVYRHFNVKKNTINC